MLLKRTVLSLLNTSKSTRKVSLIRKMSTAEDDVIFEEKNGKGILTLNRPKALNALNLSMIEKIYPALRKWEHDKQMVIVKGSGEKSFCSGGDVRAVVSAGMKGDKTVGQRFFGTEYQTNALIGTYKIPYIALIDGIVMGGGVGISVHGHYRIATERTLFAMPETQIGLFPDVGGSYFLPRLGGRLGYYLALTGYRLKGSDVQKCGIATHYVESKSMTELESALLDCKNDQDIVTTLNKFNVKDGKEFTLAPHIKKINSCFNGNTMEEIIKNLENDGSDWAKSTLGLLGKMSPTSMKVSLKLLQTGSKLELQECLQVEYRVAVACLANHDFYEGVRALLIDKDQNPKWKPAKLSEVSDALVDSHFNKLPDDQELKHKL